MESRAKQILRNLKAGMQTIRQELTVTHELIPSSEKILAEAKKYLGRTSVEYTRGVKNSPDMLGATNRYFDTRKRVMEMKRDYQLAKVRLLGLIGK